MPIYEYQCDACGRRFTAFFRSVAAAGPAACPACGGNEARRLISRFSVARPAGAASDDMALPPGLGDVDENDPGSVARWLRRMGRELGEEAGPDFAEMVDRMEAGETPDDFDGGGGSGDGLGDEF